MDREHIEDGYVLLARKVLDSDTFNRFKNSEQRLMAVVSILRANHHDVIWNGIDLKRGQFITSINNFSVVTKSTEDKVRGFWKLAEKNGFLARTTTNKYTIITVCNYCRYQDPNNYILGNSHTKTIQKPNKNQTNPKQKPIDNKDNKENKSHIPISSFWEYYLLKVEKEYKLTPERRALIEKRLAEGYSLEQLKCAVDRFVEDDWPDRSRYMDLIYCIGKQKGKGDALEKWLYKEPKTQSKGLLGIH